MLSPTTAIDRSSLHPGTGYLIAPRVPHGLAAVVEGLTREVLRHRPEDIYVFAAHHFEKLLKLREQYHVEEYSGREFNHEFNREFNLWPTKNAETRDIGKSSDGGWSLEKEIEILEGHRKADVATDMEESPEDVSTDKEHRKISKQTKGSTVTKRVSRRSKDKEITSDARATKIISQMPSLHGPNKNIQTKDIKQELRKNKLSGEKGKTVDGADKAIRGERRSRTRIPKSDKEEVERPTATTTMTTTTTSTASKTSTRRPLKKVRRIETESETETERETASKGSFENRYERSSIRGKNTSHDAIVRTGSRERRPEAQLSEHSSGRKVSSRALSMDRIRAYVLRKFASTASLEVLRSPTYVEQVQEVIDRAAPIIKEKLEEIRRPRGKRSRSVDLGWNNESIRQRMREDRKHDNGDEEEESSGRRNGSEQEVDSTEQEETESSLGRNGMKKEEKKQRRRSIGSGKRSRRRQSGDFEVVDRIDGSSKHNGKSEHESDEPRDTLEARLTATQNLLEGISKSTSELGNNRRIESSESLESEITDHGNVVSLPIVRPPSSRNSKSTTKNGADSLTLPPISPEAPKSTKKKDELSLPVLPANGNHSTVKSQEQDVSKDVEEASTMRDITSDIEDIAILPEDDHVVLDIEQDSKSKELSSDIRTFVNGKTEKDKNEILRENISERHLERCESLEEFEELEELGKARVEEVFKDSLNVTPEVVDVPPRPDSLEPNEDEIKVGDGGTDSARDNRFDGLKDKLMEIEMAQRNIEKALAGQQIAICDGGETTSQAEKSITDVKINEVGMLANEVEENVSEIKKSIDKAEISMNKEEKEDINKEKTKSTNEAEKIENIVEVLDKTESLSNEAEKSINEVEEMKDKAESLIKETEKSSATEKSEVEKQMEKSINETENLIDTIATLNAIEKCVTKMEKSTSETERTKNGMEILETEIDTAVNQVETSTKVTKKAIETIEKKKSTDENKRSVNGKLSNNDVEEELAVKVHVKDAQSVNARSQDKDDQIVETIVSETQGDSNVTVSKSKVETANKSSDTVVSENIAVKDETSRTNSVDKSSVGETQKKDKDDKSPTTSPSSAEVPFAYILSEGSPCEIPDSVTTVIIPDRPYMSPVTLEDESHQLGSTNQKEELIIRSDIAKEDETKEKDQSEYGMEAFGEYVRPEHPTNNLPIDIDFVRGVKGAKLGQEVMIVHQDLDKIKEEGEEEEEGKEKHVEEVKIDSSQEKNDDKQEVVRSEEAMKLVGTLENIVEHEENEETDTRTNAESKDVEEIVLVDIPANESLPDTIELINTDVTNNGRADIMIEAKDTLENSSEESGSTQDNRTLTSSDAKESITSNQSVESSSLGRPVVPELNLDSLQDNTVSSFKMTANGTTKEDNSSLRESDATTSLIEPLTSDERLMNERKSTLDHKEEEIPVKQLTGDLSRDQQSVPEADQLYQAEHAEYVWLEKDPLSETSLEDEVKSQEDSTGLMSLPEDIVQVGPLLQEKKEEEKLNSEEEIARELIGSLNEEMEVRAKLGSKEESKDSGESGRSNLAMDDNTSQALSVPSTSIDEPKQKEHEISSEESKKLDEVTKTKVMDKLNHIADISQNDKDKKDIETEKSKSVEEKEETTQPAPLAQFEKDELLELNNRPGTANEKSIVESKPNIIDTDSSDNQEKHENKKTSVKEVLENQGKESIDKAKDLNKQQEKNEQEKIPEKSKQKELKMQEENDQGNLKLQEEIVNTEAVPSEITESKKDSINESIKNDKKHDENDRANHDKSVTSEKEDEKETTEEKTKDLSTEGDSVQKSITSTISEQSIDHPHGGYWTMGTKSSTVETVIETVSPNTSIDKEVKAAADASEIVEDESLNTKKDDFYLAVVKIQACIRGFLARRRMQKDLCLKPVSDSIPSAQKTTDDDLAIPQDTSNLRETRSIRRLRREEALQNTTLSLENAFATGRLQHTSEFHDSVPLPLFDVTNSEFNSIPSNESSSKEEDTEQAKQSVAKPSTNDSDSVLSHSHDDEHARNFQKSTSFANHSTFPIVMHLMTDTSRNGHFRVNQSYDPNYNPTVGGTKPMKQAMDILMLGYPRDDDNRYLNFITSVEDLGSNTDSLSLDDAVKISKSTDDAHPSMTSGEGSIREPLALPGTPQGIVIEEMTSLDETVPSDSMKLSTTPKASLDTNSSVPSEEPAFEDKKDYLGVSPSTVDVIGDREHTDEGADRQKLGETLLGDDNLESVKDVDSHAKDASEKSNGFAVSRES